MMRTPRVMAVLTALVACVDGPNPGGDNRAPVPLPEPLPEPAPPSTKGDEGIVSIQGQVNFLSTPPPSVELWDLVSDRVIFVFAEKKDHVLTTDLTLDLAEPGDYLPNNVRGTGLLSDDEDRWATLNPGVVPAGTRVSSYYFHFDNLSYQTSPQGVATQDWHDEFNVYNYSNCMAQIGVTGRVTFAEPVLGIVMRASTHPNANLYYADLELGLDSVSYTPFEDYGTRFPGLNLADGCGTDRFRLSDDRKTLWFTNHSDVHHDNYRVVVAAP